MKGYYEINIRRAGTKALRKLSFHNHIKPGLYDILFAKSVSDSTNSVVDTLVLGNGVGEHSDTAKSITGDVVFEKKYNSYTPPTQSMLSSIKTDLIHTFMFSGFVDEICEVGEVAIGAYVNDVFIAASMIHVQDAMGNPTKITLLPGDEITINWSLAFTRPYVLATDGSVPSSEVVVNRYFGSNITTEYDLDLIKSYPNWNLMGYSRITEIIFATNKLLTNTDWFYRVYSATENKERPTTADELSSYPWMSNNNPYITTNFNDPDITPSGVLYIPFILMPLKIINYANNNLTQTTPFTSGFNTVLMVEDAYSDWKKQFADSQIKTLPTTIDSVSAHFYGTIENDTDEDVVVISTTPFVYVTVYVGEERLINGLADEFGKFKFKLPPDRTSTLPKSYTVVAHTHKESKAISFTLEYKDDPSEMIFFSGLDSITSTKFIRFTCKRSRAGKVYRAVVEYDLVPDEDGNTRENFSVNYDNIGPRITYITTNIDGLRIGDKIKVTLLGSTNNVLHSVFNYTVDSLELTQYHTLQTKQNPYDDHVTVRVKKVK